MTYAVATTSERVRTDKSDHCACARMRDMRLDESWTGRIWDHNSGTVCRQHRFIFKCQREQHIAITRCLLLLDEASEIIAI